MVADASRKISDDISASRPEFGGIRGTAASSQSDIFPGRIAVYDVAVLAVVSARAG